ncbi:MAG: DUF4367 domain-containing protein [Ruminococcus sp.]|nr:DUF4367 domain-containing protein [Ruminococcus sp.]
MNNKELFHNISNITEADKELLKELQVQLDEELNKPIKQQDFDLIEEITKTICEIHNENELIEAKTKSGIAFLKGRKTNVNKLKIRKWSAVFVSCAAVILALNIASFSALGMNIFSAAYQFTKGGIFIDMSNDNNIELPVTSADPYGMKAKCAEYDMYPLTPTYIPEGLELTDLHEEKGSAISTIIFHYEKDDIILNFNYTMYSEERKIPPIGIPTDTYNVVEEQINGHKMYILKEDNQFTATFLEDNIVYTITAIDCDYDECQKVIESLVE